MGRRSLVVALVVSSSCVSPRIDSLLGDVQISHGVCDWSASLPAVPGNSAHHVSSAVGSARGAITVGNVFVDATLSVGTLLSVDAITSSFASSDTLYTWSSRGGLRRHVRGEPDFECEHIHGEVIDGAVDGSRVVLAVFDADEKSSLLISTDSCGSFTRLVSGSGGQLYSPWFDGALVRALLAYPQGETEVRSWALDGSTRETLELGLTQWATTPTGERSFVTWGFGATERSMLDGGQHRLVSPDIRVQSFCLSDAEGWVALGNTADGGVVRVNERGDQQSLPGFWLDGSGRCVGDVPVVNEAGHSTPLVPRDGEWWAVTAGGMASRRFDAFDFSKLDCARREVLGVTRTGIGHVVRWVGSDAGWRREAVSLTETVTSADGLTVALRVSNQRCVAVEIDGPSGERIDLPGPCISTGIELAPVPYLHNLTRGIGFHFFSPTRDGVRCSMVTANSERFDVVDCGPSFPAFVQRDPSNALRWISYGADDTSLTDDGGKSWSSLSPRKQFVFGPNGALHQVDGAPRRAIGFAAKPGQISWVLVDERTRSFEVVHVAESIVTEAVDGAFIGVDGNTLVFASSVDRDTKVRSY